MSDSSSRRRFLNPRRPASALLLAAGVTVALTGAGCADAITYSSSERNAGQVYLAEGDPASAAGIFANQVRQSPKDYRAHYHLGEARMALGRDAEAIRSFRTGLEVRLMSPRGTSDGHYRGLLIDALSTALAEHDADGSQLVMIEERSKGNVDLKLVGALTHAKAGRPDPAMVAFREAQMIDRSDALVAKQYGLYLERVGQDAAAEEVLRRAYTLNTRDEEVATALRRLGVVPGPSLMSRNHLASPPLPRGPLPEVKVSELLGLPAAGADPAPAADDGQDPSLN